MLAPPLLPPVHPHCITHDPDILHLADILTLDFLGENVESILERNSFSMNDLDSWPGTWHDPCNLENYEHLNHGIHLAQGAL